MKTLLLIGFATLGFAASEPVVSLRSLKEVEGSINDRFKSNISDPYDLLGGARGTYLEGYGAVFSVQMNLVLLPALAISPFTPDADKKIVALHEHKLRKIETLKATMRDLMTSAGKSLTAVPPQEKIVIESFLYYYSYEETRGLPQRVTLIVSRQKLLDAASRHATPAEMTALFQEDIL